MSDKSDEQALPNSVTQLSQNSEDHSERQRHSKNQIFKNEGKDFTDPVPVEETITPQRSQDSVDETITPQRSQDSVDPKEQLEVEKSIIENELDTYADMKEKSAEEGGKDEEVRGSKSEKELSAALTAKIGQLQDYKRKYEERDDQLADDVPIMEDTESNLRERLLRSEMKVGKLEAEIEELLEMKSESDKILEEQIQEHVSQYTKEAEKLRTKIEQLNEQMIKSPSVRSANVQENSADGSSAQIIRTLNEECARLRHQLTERDLNLIAPKPPELPEMDQKQTMETMSFNNQLASLIEYRKTKLLKHSSLEKKLKSGIVSLKKIKANVKTQQLEINRLRSEMLRSSDKQKVLSSPRKVSTIGDKQRNVSHRKRYLSENTVNWKRRRSESSAGPAKKHRRKPSFRDPMVQLSSRISEVELTLETQTNEFNRELKSLQVACDEYDGAMKRLLTGNDKVDDKQNEHSVGGVGGVTEQEDEWSDDEIKTPCTEDEVRSRGTLLNVEEMQSKIGEFELRLQNLQCVIHEENSLMNVVGKMKSQLSASWGKNWELHRQLSQFRKLIETMREKYDMNEIRVAESPRSKRARMQSIDYELFRHDILPNSRRSTSFAKIDQEEGLHHKVGSIDYELFHHDILPSSRRPSMFGKVDEGKIGTSEISTTLEIDQGNSVGWPCPSIPETSVSLSPDRTCSSSIPPEDGGDKKQKRIEKLQKKLARVEDVTTVKVNRMREVVQTKAKALKTKEREIEQLYTKLESVEGARSQKMEYLEDLVQSREMALNQLRNQSDLKIKNLQEQVALLNDNLRLEKERLEGELTSERGKALKLERLVSDLDNGDQNSSILEQEVLRLSGKLEESRQETMSVSKSKVELVQLLAAEIERLRSNACIISMRRWIGNSES